MTPYQFLLSWFYNALASEKNGKILMHCLISFPFLISLIISCIHYDIGLSKLLDILCSEKGMPLFANIGAVIYANIQEDEIQERLSRFILYMMDHADPMQDSDPALYNRSQKLVIKLLKNKLQEEPKTPEIKSE